MKRFLCFLLWITSAALLFSREPMTMNLDESIGLALTRNSGIISDNLDRQDAWRRLRLQLRQFFPALQLGYSRNDSVKIDDPDSRINKVSLSMNQLLFNGGRDLADYRSARRDLQLRDLQGEDLMDSIEYKVTVQYVEVLKNREILDLQKRSFENLQEQIRIAELEHRLGELTDIDYLDIRLRAKEFSLNLQDTEEQLLQSRFSLATLLYFPLEHLPRLEGFLNTGYRGIYPDRIAEGEPFVLEMREKAEEYNKDLMGIYLQEINAQRDLLDSKIAWIPKIEGKADFSVSGQEYPLNEPSFSVGLDFTFDTPLLPGSLSMQAGKTGPEEHNRGIQADADVLENLGGLVDPYSARSNLYKKQMEKEELRRSIFFQVRSLTETIGMTADRIAVQKEKIAILDDKLRIEEQKMYLGEITRLDYVESEIEIAEQKTALLESIVGLYSREKELEILCGIHGRSEEEHLILYEGGSE